MFGNGWRLLTGFASSYIFDLAPVPSAEMVGGDISEIYEMEIWRMFGANVHPFHELIIKERLDPRRGQVTLPVVTEPIVCRERVTDRIRAVLRSSGSLFRSNPAMSCCPVPCS